MSFTSLLTHRLVIERPVKQMVGSAIDVDEMGHAIRTWEVLAETRGLVQPMVQFQRTHEQPLTSQAGAVIGDYVIFLPAQDITLADRIYFDDPADWHLAGLYGAGDDTRLEVIGVRNAAGRNHHLEVDANVVKAPPEELGGS